MHLKRQDMEAATQAGLITENQAQKLWMFWQTEQENIPQFHFTHILYYFGGLLAISAITLFVTKAWDQLRGIPLLVIAIFLFLLGLKLTHYFLQKKLRIPAGIMATFSLAVVPLAIYNIQIALGLEPPIQTFQYRDFHYWINWYWVPMEGMTFLVGLVMFYYYRFPFLFFPIAVVLWYLSMDLWPLLFQPDNYSWQEKAVFSMIFGLTLLLCTISVDLKSEDRKEDYLYWLYMVGVMVFWGGLSSQQSNSELSKFFYCLINVIMIFVSVLLDRRVFAIFGAIGVLIYLGHLALTIFADSLGFPLVLIILGLLLIFIATQWTKIELKLLNYLHPYIPKKILNRIEADKNINGSSI